MATATRTRPAYSGRCRQRPGLAGRAGPVARPLARHKQSTGLFVSGLGLPHRLRPTRQPEGADAAGRNAEGRRLQADAVRRHPGLQPARGRALRRRRPPGAGAAVPLHHAAALQAAPGQWPGASPGTNSPPDCLCPGSALANERVQTNAAGQVVLKLKTPWRDGTIHLVLRRGTNSPVDCLCQPKGPSSARARPARLSPLEFMQRLAALVPRPRLHLIRLVSA